MTRKTIHLISIPRSALPGTPDLTAVLGAHPAWAGLPPFDTAARLTGGTLMLELPLANASRAEAAELARRVSAAWPRAKVDVHFQVNAWWVPGEPGGGQAEETAQVIHVRASVRDVLRALRTHPGWCSGLDVHVQARQDQAVVVLHGTPAPEAVSVLAAQLDVHAGPTTVTWNERGSWVANGSRHHEFTRFQRGVQVQFRTDHVWVE